MPAQKKSNSKPATKDAGMLVTFLLDRTGSMQSCRDATIEAYNAYVGTLKTDMPETLFTFLQFDSVSIDKVYVAEPIEKVELLTPMTYQPRASTPLIDAAVKTIKAVETALESRKDKPKVVVCFHTDGEENCSTEHTWDELNKLIKDKSAEGWQFNFMGAGIDAYKHAQKMGVAAVNTMSYNRNDLGQTKAAFVASAHSTTRFGSGFARSTAYSSAERSRAGDAFVPADLKVDLTVTAGAQKHPLTGKHAKTVIVDDLDLTTPAS